MAKYDPNMKGTPLPPQEEAALQKVIEGYAPIAPDYGFDNRGNLKDPKLSAAGRHANEMQQHMSASRSMFLDERDKVWAKREVDPKTPFKHGPAPLPQRRLTDNELRRGEMTRAEAIMDRAKRNEDDYKGR